MHEYCMQISNSTFCRGLDNDESTDEPNASSKGLDLVCSSLSVNEPIGEWNFIGEMVHVWWYAL